jgi:cyclopropane-fatty-acyl-phospholipid synthase
VSGWSLPLWLAERGWLPDGLVRAGIRRLCRRRLREEAARGRSDADFAAEMRTGPVAPVPEAANEQHYEVPPAFFLAALGPRLKYSSCCWPEGVANLAAAEEASLAQVAERALLADGQDVLELGCGWGSFSLYAAQRYPRSRITAVSNSAPQREFIEGRARERSLGNLRVLTADMNRFAAEGLFDRVVSVEMFEHMRNWEELLRRVAGWLRPDGRLFLHVFAHRRFAYAFETQGAANWMGRHFFTGGIMPSLPLVDRFAGHMQVEERWVLDGTHYARTAEEWLDNLDARRKEVRPVLIATYGAGEARRWLSRWRIFFLACAELFGYGGGREWCVGHYRLKPTERRPG